MAFNTFEKHGSISLYDLVAKIGADLQASDHFRPIIDTVSGAIVDVTASASIGVFDTYNATGAAGIAGLTTALPTEFQIGKLASIQVTNPGTKYSSAPIVTISQPNQDYNTIAAEHGWTITGTQWYKWLEVDNVDTPEGYVNGTNRVGGASSVVAGLPAYLADLSTRALGKNFSYVGAPDAGPDKVWIKYAITVPATVRATATSTIGADGTVTEITLTNAGIGYDPTKPVTVSFSNTHSTTACLLLESTEKIDPLGTKLNQDGTVASDQTGTQPWRIYFELLDGSVNPANTGGQLGVYLGTAGTLRAEPGASSAVVGYVVDDPAIYNPKRVEPAGNTGAQWDRFGTYNTQNLDMCFMNRIGRVDPSVAAAYPISYRLTLTNRGLFLGMWEANTEETGKGFNWLLVQRSVDRLSGEVRDTGRCPVFCLNAVNGKYYKFVVRENDLYMPSKRKTANANDEDSAAVINTYNQQSLTESGEYVITFISNLNTARYKYADELDIMGTVSADVIGAGTSINVKVYGEAQDRTYQALYPSDAYGTGMRVMVLVNNPNESQS